MIYIEDTVLPSDDQWEAVVHGVRNPYASWDREDSKWVSTVQPSDAFQIGEKDLALMAKLSKAGNDHGKFMRMLPVICSISAPLTFWKHLDQYKVGTVTDSTSTMHCIQNIPFNLNTFSHEGMDSETMTVLTNVIAELNRCRYLYNETKDPKYWNSMINLLPESLMQLRTWSGNYQVLKNIYHARKNHRLGDWHIFCDWIKTLPYARELITYEE